MCLVVLFHRQIDGFPVVLGANREEAYSRSSLSPHWIAGHTVFAGKDERAGGTWFGINRHGLSVAITNRCGSENADVMRSRGLLCLDSLAFSSSETAVDWVDGHLQKTTYNPFNLLITDGNDAYVVYGDLSYQVIKLEPGIHVLAETDVDDLKNPRIVQAFNLLDNGNSSNSSAVVDLLKAVFSRHGDGEKEQEWMCRHMRDRGTVSSTILTMSTQVFDGITYLHTVGPPCSHPYEDLSLVLRENT